MYSIDPVPGYGFFHGYVGVKGISYESVQGVGGYHFSREDLNA